MPESAEGPRHPAGRSLAPWPAPAALRRLHGGDRRRAGARRRDPTVDVHRSTIRKWTRTRAGGKRPAPPATRRTGKVLNYDRADWREAWPLFPGDVADVWHGALHAATVAESCGGGRLPNPVASSSGPRSGWCSDQYSRGASPSPRNARAHWIDRRRTWSARPRPSRARPGVPPRSPRASSKGKLFVQNNLAVHTPALRIVQNCATNVTQLCTEGMGVDHRLRAGLGGALRAPADLGSRRSGRPSRDLPATEATSIARSQIRGGKRSKPEPAGAAEGAALGEGHRCHVGDRQTRPALAQRRVPSNTQGQRRAVLGFVDLPEANDLTVGIMALVAQQQEREATSPAHQGGAGGGKEPQCAARQPAGRRGAQAGGRGAAALRAAIARNADRHALDLAPVVEDIRAGWGHQPQGHRRRA